MANIGHHNILRDSKKILLTPQMERVFLLFEKKRPRAKIVFSLLDKSITSENVHRLELWRSFKCWVAVAT